MELEGKKAEMSAANEPVAVCVTEGRESMARLATMTPELITTKARISYARPEPTLDSLGRSVAPVRHH